MPDLTVPDLTVPGPAAAGSGAADTSGLAMFARFAYPPNQRGYCGPAEHEALLAYARGGSVDDRLVDIARQFDGPLPYLRTLAGPDGDPFAPEVVAAYWLGGPLLDRFDRTRFAAEVESTFRGQPTVDWDRVTTALPRGVPHHTFHVLITYPWLGLLDRPGDTAIGVLDRCRIRWGQVESVADGLATVRSRSLVHRDGALSLGQAQVEEGVAAVLGDGGTVQPGAWVALHWEWICDLLTAEQVSTLERWTVEQVAMVNAVGLVPASP